MDYKYFELRFKNQKGHIISNSEKEIVYEALLKNFKDRGQNDSYELLDIEYHDFVFGKYSIRHLWNCYGYHKEWVFYWAAIFLFIFSIINFFCFEYLINMVYYIEFFEDRKFSHKMRTENGDYVDSKPIINNQLSRFWNKLWYSFAYTVIIFFLFSLKMENFDFNVLHKETTAKIKHISGLIYVVLIYATGIACLAYMANFVLQK